MLPPEKVRKVTCQEHVTYLTEPHHCIEGTLFFDDLLHVLVCKLNIVCRWYWIKAVVWAREDIGTTLCRWILIVGVEELVLEVLG